MAHVGRLMAFGSRLAPRQPQLLTPGVIPHLHRHRQHRRHRSPISWLSRSAPAGQVCRRRTWLDHGKFLRWHTSAYPYPNSRKNMKKNLTSFTTIPRLEIPIAPASSKRLGTVYQTCTLVHPGTCLRLILACHSWTSVFPRVPTTSTVHTSMYIWVWLVLTHVPPRQRPSPYHSLSCNFADSIR